MAEASELEDVTDAQRTTIGFNAIQLKRLRKQVPAVRTQAPPGITSFPGVHLKQWMWLQAAVAVAAPPAQTPSAVNAAALSSQSPQLRTAATATVLLAAATTTVDQSVEVSADKTIGGSE